MSTDVTIVDYGIGNLFSARRAFEHCGAAKVSVTSNEEEIRNASFLVLPGVGAFRKGIEGLAEMHLIGAVKDYAASGRPLLGICLGMQLFATRSYEFGETEGLDLIAGNVRKMPQTTDSGESIRVPFVGWAKVEVAQPDDPGQRSVASLDGKHMYHVHSYMFEAERPENLVASYTYGDTRISAAVQHENVIGVQFHPEKSGRDGLQFLKHLIDSLPA